MSDRVPHDPLVNEPPRHCPDCDEPWPCAVRKQQRYEKKWIEDLLRSDAYKPVPLLDSDPPGVRWESPLGWSVWMTYGEQGVPATIRRPDGQTFAATTYATREWLDEVLP